jgi:branched-chain amino acid transport system permease protein
LTGGSRGGRTIVAAIAEHHVAPRQLLRRAQPALPALALVAVQLVLFPLPLGEWLRGVLLGGLTALIALGMALTYRSNRIVDFAHADLGTAPVVLSFLLINSWGWSYLPSLAAGILSALLLGAVVELAVIRRFAKAPRLLLTVATLGLAQLLAAGAILLPKAFGEQRLLAPILDPPFHLDVEIGGTFFHANDAIAAAVIPLVCVALAVFLRRTRAGVAIRAAAESGDRALSLGIPVQRLQTLVWSIAALMAFVAVFLRSGMVGLPVTTALSFGLLLRALAALLLGRMTNLVTIASAGVALGLLEAGIAFNAESPLLVEPIIGLVIAIALLVQRRQHGSRVDLEDVSTWVSTDEVRPIPKALQRLPSVRLTKYVGIGLLTTAALVLPHLLRVDRNLKASAVLVYATLVLSLVVLTGWAGQVSLGQIGFFAVGATVGAKATLDWGLDLTIALVVAFVAGAGTAALVGLPALRLRGLYLAVTTFAFSLAATSYLLNPRFFDWVPTERIARPPLLGQIDIDSPTRMYYVCLGGFLVIYLALAGIRRSRTGRALLALRDNERAAQAYALDPMRTRLTGFALSGGIAAFAGCLFVHHQQAIDEASFFAGENFAVFSMAVVGGVASPAGALLGATFVEGIRFFLPVSWQLLASGLGLLLVLLLTPSGLGGLVLRGRDAWLQKVAVQRGIDAPGFVATRLDTPSLPTFAAGAVAAPTETDEVGEPEPVVPR